MPNRIGRPMVLRNPDERVPLASKIKGELYNQLISAALSNKRQLATEVEIRLEASLGPVGTPQAERQRWLCLTQKDGTPILINTELVTDVSKDENGNAVVSFSRKHYERVIETYVEVVSLLIGPA